MLVFSIPCLHVAFGCCSFHCFLDAFGPFPSAEFIPLPPPVIHNNSSLIRSLLKFCHSCGALFAGATLDMFTCTEFLLAMNADQPLVEIL